MGKKERAFVPRKAAVKLTEQARKFFKALLESQSSSSSSADNIIGIQLNYQQSNTGEPRMVFSFRFVTAADLGPLDEGVSLELVPAAHGSDPDHTTSTNDGNGSDDNDGGEPPVVQQRQWIPKPPAQAARDGLPKLYVAADAFLKVLGATVDVDTTTVTPILYDREGNKMDPNA